MPAKTTDTVKHIHYLGASQKAPRITEASARLADQPAVPVRWGCSAWIGVA